MMRSIFLIAFFVILGKPLVGCKSVGTSTLTSGIVDNSRDFGLGEVYVKPITNEIIAILPHLADFNGHILLGNLQIQIVFKGMSGASDKAFEKKVHDQKIMRVFKRRDKKTWEMEPFQGLKFAVGNQPLSEMEDVSFSPVTASKEAGISVSFRQATRRYELYVSLGSSASFIAMEFRSQNKQTKVSKLGLIFDTDHLDVVGPLKGERGQSVGFYQKLKEISVVSLQSFTLSKTEDELRMDVVAPELKFEFLLFVDAPEQQMATTAALAEGSYGRLKLRCVKCDLPVSLFVLTQDREPLFKLTASPVLERNFVMPVGTYIFSEDSLGLKVWSQKPVEIIRDLEHIYEVSNRGSSQIIVKIDPSDEPRGLSSFEIFKKDSTTGQPFLVMNEPEPVVHRNKIVTEKNVLSLTLPSDQYTARLISQWHGKLCEFDIKGPSNQAVEHDCRLSKGKADATKWVDHRQHFEKISFTESRFRWPITIYPVSVGTKELWQNMFGDRDDIQVSEARDFLNIRKSMALVVLGCPDFSRTLTEFETTLRGLQPDAVEVFGCNLRYDYSLYIGKVVEVMNGIQRNVVFISPDENAINRLPPKLAIFDKSVPGPNELEKWAGLMRRGEFSLVWGSRLQPSGTTLSTREVEIKNLPGAFPRKIIFISNHGKSIEVPIRDTSDSLELIKEKVPKFPHASWWRAEVWGSWGKNPAANEELTLLGVTNFQKNL